MRFEGLATILGASLMQHRLCSAALLLTLSALAPVSQAADCEPSSGQSPCVPAGALWLRPGHSRFALLPDPELSGAGGLSASLGTEYLLLPLVLDVASPDPEGREVRLVHHRILTSLGARAGLAQGWDVGASLPVVVFQTGAGTEGVTDRAAEPIASPVLSDPRVESRLRAFSDGNLALDLGITLLLPLGNQGAHAGERGFVAAPEALGYLTAGKLSLGLGVTSRLRQRVELGGVSHGSEAGLLAAFQLRLAERWIALGGELSLMSGFSPTQTDLSNGERQSQLERPAQWLVSVASEPSRRFRLVLAGGGAIPLSQTTREGGSSYSAGLGVPAFHGLLNLQYVISAENQQ